MTKTIDRLVEMLETYNKAYREGNPLVSDHEYDGLVEELRDVAPSHSFLKTVEPEKFEAKVEVKHPMPMLSTEKAYEVDDLARFVARVHKAATEIGISDVEFRVTAKLDGLAGRDDGTVFASRGNGIVGFEISSAFTKGVVAVGGRGCGLGEIVMSKSYFEDHLATDFEHPRNMVVGIVASDKLNGFAKKALDDGAVRFVPYSELPTWKGPGDDLVKTIDRIQSDLLEHIDYPVDGLVAEVTNEALREYMGATAHHYRWQIAIKTRGETAASVVENIVWQVGRTGNVTPVMEIKPVKLSGATIRRVTAHNAGLVLKSRIGIGAEIEIIRSGEVIPKLEKVIKESPDVVTPETCPVCATNLVWNNDFLKCTNMRCAAKIEQALVHWFKILGTADWFGIKTIKKLVAQGWDRLETIYSMVEKDFLDLDFGPVQSKNLEDAIRTSITKEVEDWRFLAAFGIRDLGKGDSRKLLSHFRIDQLVGISGDDIEAIHGFGQITSKSIAGGIAEISETMKHMLDLGFNLEKTPLLSEVANSESPLAGKGIVFTGKMNFGSRDDMQSLARKLGAIVQSAVSGKTGFLVCGENVGAKKIEKAEKSGVKILTEQEFHEIMNQ